MEKKLKFIDICVLSAIIILALFIFIFGHKNSPGKISGCKNGQFQGLILDAGSGVNDSPDKELKIGDKNLRAAIIKAILPDYSNAESTCNIVSAGIHLVKVDLNGDAKDEYVVAPEYFLTKDNNDVGAGGVRGMSGNGSYYVLSPTKMGWKLVGEFFGNILARFNAQKTDSYSDLLVNSHDSAGSGEITKYSWNGSEYEESDNVLYDNSNGSIAKNYNDAFGSDKNIIISQ